MSDLTTALDPFLGQVRAAMADAALICNSVRGLPGNYGRYALGSRFGIQTDSVTAQDALSAQTTARDLINRICDGIETLGQTGDTVNLAACMPILMAAVASAAEDPADAVRILSGLASYQPPSVVGTVGQTVAALCRQSALSALYSVTRTVYLSSLNDAVTLLLDVVGLIDAEMTYCGDAFADATFSALDRMRAAVTADILARGASLAPLRTFTFGASLPAAVVAQRLYQTGSREGEVIDRVNPVHPLFMPGVMTLLAR